MVIKDTKKRYNAFVLGMTPNGLGVVRALGRQGVNVYALDSHQNWPGMFSKYCESIVSPHVETEGEKYLDFLLDIGKQLDQPGVLFPTGDAYVTFVSENRELLRNYFKFAMSEKSIMRQLLNKKTQYSLAENLGIPLPKTFYPRHLGEVEELDGKINYPVIIKPLYSINWRRVYSTKKVQLVTTGDGLFRAYEKIQRLNIDFMIQEVVLGSDANNYKICLYLNRNSEPLLVFTLKKIRNYPCNFGVGSVVESQWIPEVADLGLRFLKGVKYVGIGSIEFKKDLRDNQLKMIELNSRLWLQNSLAERCGMNFPYTQYLDLSGSQVEKQSKFEQGVKWISMASDFASFRGYHAENKLSYFNWLRSLTGRKTFAIFAWDDLKPFLYSIEYGLEIFKKFFKVIKSIFPKRI